VGYTFLSEAAADHIGFKVIDNRAKSSLVPARTKRAPAFAFIYLSEARGEGDRSRRACASQLGFKTWALPQSGYCP
jgi:hypothetical protein